MRRAVGIASATGALALVAAGCSSNSSGASSAGSSGSSEITIGSIDTLTGPEASGFAGVQQTQQAWADYTNAHGGIDGHKVKLVILDDGGSGPTALQDAKQLVEQDHVVAIASAMTDADPSFASYVDAVKIPVVGGSDIDTEWETNPYYFPQGQTTSVQDGTQVQLAKQAGATKFGWLYCTEVATCAESTPVFSNYAKQIGGISLAYSAGISATQPSYTAPCLAAKAAGVNAMEVGEAPIAWTNVATACATQGFHPQWIASSSEVNASNLATSALNGMIVQLVDFPWIDQSTPATKAYYDALKTYEPSVLTGAGFDASSSEAWTALQLFAAAVQAGHPGSSVTTADVLNGLWSLKDDTLGGLAPPLTFTQGKPAGNVTCGFVVADKNGKWAETQGLKIICTPAPSFKI
jgi:branched-chain amino acid transport system substrate-binding protein